MAVRRTARLDLPWLAMSQTTVRRHHSALIPDAHSRRATQRRRLDAVVVVAVHKLVGKRLDKHLKNSG